MFAFGYYIGRRSGQQELLQDWTEVDPQDRDQEQT
jgi:hypothetical protein